MTNTRMDEASGEESIDHGVLLGAWIRRRREALGLTQEQVAERMGESVPGNYATQLENGGRKRMISQPRLGQLARALQVSEIDLLRGAGVLTEPIAELDAIPNPFPHDPIKREIVERLATLNPADAQSVWTFVDYTVKQVHATAPVQT